MLLLYYNDWVPTAMQCSVNVLWREVTHKHTQHALPSPLPLQGDGGGRGGRGSCGGGRCGGAGQAHPAAPHRGVPGLLLI